MIKTENNYKRILISLIPLLAFIPISIFRDITPNNELRYFSIIDEAIANNYFFAFYNQGNIYADKPPLYFWIMMVGRKLFGDFLLEFMLIVNLAISFVITYTMNKWCFTVNQIKQYSAAALAFLTTGYVMGVIAVVRMDLMMTMFIVLSLYSFYSLYTNKNIRLNSCLFPVYVFLAIFSKGAVGILIPLLSTIVFLVSEKKIKDIFIYWGLKTWLILIVLCAIWFTGIYFDGGTEYLNNILFHQTVNRAVNSFHHKEPFYFYLWRFWMTAAPWSILFIVTLIKGLKWKVVFKDKLLKFFFVIIVTSVVMLSIISSKIDIYLIPIYPFVIYLTFVILTKVKSSLIIKISTAILPVILILILPCLPFFDKFSPIELSHKMLAYFSAVISFIGGVISLLYIKRNLILKSVIVSSSALLMLVFFSSFQITPFNEILGMKNLADKGAELKSKNNAKSFVSYKAGRTESMDYYLKEEIITAKTLEELKDTTLYKRPYILFLKTKNISKDEALKAFIDGRKGEKMIFYSTFVIE
ncbi:MAG: glycosyltransferase family 39 protein [Bacteroidales bacterium]|nr:glycosyltransferase family 39 protein [Bacteroidales bacterium]